MDAIAINKMAFSLILIIGVLIMVFLILSKFKKQFMSQSGVIQPKSWLNLGAKEKIVLIEVENKSILVGVTPNQIQTLYVFERKTPFQQELVKAEEEMLHE